MTVTVMTDAELDRILSVRVSSAVPLPPEIALCGPSDADRVFGRRTFYALMGVSDDPLIRMLDDLLVRRAMASQLSKADHLDRVSHYRAWLGDAPVAVTDMTGDRKADGATVGPTHRVSDPAPDERR